MEMTSFAPKEFFLAAKLVSIEKLASSRRSLSWGSVQRTPRKTAREKTKGAARGSERKFFRFLLPQFFFFARWFSRCAPTNWTPGRGYRKIHTQNLEFFRITRLELRSLERNYC